MRIPNISTSFIEYDINPKSFINAHNFPTFKDLIEEIKRIDNDPYAFESMLREPVFLNNFNPNEFYTANVRKFLNYIVSQGPINAKRVGIGIRLEGYKDFMLFCKKQKYKYRIKNYRRKFRKFVSSICRKKH